MVDNPEKPEVEAVKKDRRWLKVRDVSNKDAEVIPMEEYEVPKEKATLPVMVPPKPEDLDINGKDKRPVRGRSRFPQYGQAEHIMKKFGGYVRMARLLKQPQPVIYKWNCQPPMGTDGLIPTKFVSIINKLAREQGILLTEEDWAIRPLKWDVSKYNLARGVVPLSHPSRKHLTLLDLLK